MTPTSGVSDTATALPATPTSTPTEAPSSELTATPTLPVGANEPGDEGFRTFLRVLDGGLQAHGGLAIKARWRTIDVVCTAADVPRRSDGAACETEGQAYEGVATGNWRSEGGIVPVDTVNGRLDEASSTQMPDVEDEFGHGGMRVYATSIGDGVYRTVSTAIISPPPDFGPVDRIRAAWVVEWEFGAERWEATRIVFAYVLAEELLRPPTPDTVGLLPDWERYE